MDVITTKGVVIVIIFLVTIFPQLLPLCLVRMRNGRLALSARGQLALEYLTCFAGGAFLGACLLHLLAEGLEQFEDYKQRADLDLDFPLFEALIAAGLFLIAFVEKLGHAVKVRRSVAAAKSVEPAKSVDAAKRKPPVQANGTIPTIAYNLSQPEEVVTDLPEIAGSAGQTHDTVAVDNYTRGEQVSVKPAGEQRVSETATGGQEVCDGVSEGHQASHVTAPFQESGLRAVVLLAALSFHTIFDGLAIGLQDTVEDVWAVSTAVIVHKALVAFCLGLELSTPWRHAPLHKTLLPMFFFSLVAPVGLAIGIIVTSTRLQQTTELLVSSVLQALATGTFLYVTFFEILAPHLSHTSHKHSGPRSHGNAHDFLKIFVTALGFGAMAGVKILDKD